MLQLSILLFRAPHATTISIIIYSVDFLMLQLSIVLLYLSLYCIYIFLFSVILFSSYEVRVKDMSIIIINTLLKHHAD